MSKPLSYRSNSSENLKNEALHLWFEFEVLVPEKNLFSITWNWKKILFKSTDYGLNSSIWFKIAHDKQLTYYLLEKTWLPIAKSYYLSQKDLEKFSENDLHDFLFPLIIKPLDWAHWHWVMMNISSFNELSNKLLNSFEKYTTMIIQEQIEWNEYRVLVCGNEIIVAFNRIPPIIVWDWTHTIDELIEDENESNKYRWENYSSSLSKIVIDDELIEYIGKQWYSMETILSSWVELQLRWNSNVWTWGTIDDVTDQMHPSFREICLKASSVAWLHLCWVDVITKDISKPFDEVWWIILELNATPWFWPIKLMRENPAKKMLEIIFK